MAELIPFKEANAEIKGEPNYYDIPAHSCDTEDGARLITTCYQLTKEEIKEINNTGRVYLTLLTFPGGGISPQLLNIKKPPWI